jgi:hypothetical protein
VEASTVNRDLATRMFTLAVEWGKLPRASYNHPRESMSDPTIVFYTQSRVSGLSNGAQQLQLPLENGA